MPRPSRRSSKGGPFAWVALADVLVEDVDGWAVAVDEGFEAAAGFDGIKLVVVANDDRLGAGEVDGGEELGHRLVVCHAGLVDEEHGPVVEGELLMLEPPHERGDGAAIDAGFFVERAGGLSADGGAEDAVAVSFLGGSHDVERGGLGGARDAGDEVEGSA